MPHKCANIAPDGARLAKAINKRIVMGRKYNSSLIKGDYSYYVEQVADLLCNDVATVRRWIRDEGLERVPHSRPHLIHSSKLKAFIDKQQAKQKKPCAPQEVFCFRCQSPRTPEMGSAYVVLLPNNSTGFKAICNECGGKMNRSIRVVEWSENHPLAVYLRDATGEHSGAQPLHRECSLEKEETHG